MSSKINENPQTEAEHAAYIEHFLDNNPAVVENVIKNTEFGSRQAFVDAYMRNVREQIAATAAAAQRKAEQEAAKSAEKQAQAERRARALEKLAEQGLCACDRCGGQGGWKGWPGYTCYKCGGQGVMPYVRTWVVSYNTHAYADHSDNARPSQRRVRATTADNAREKVREMRMAGKRYIGMIHEAALAE